MPGFHTSCILLPKVFAICYMQVTFFLKSQISLNSSAKCTRSLHQSHTSFTPFIVFCEIPSSTRGICFLQKLSDVLQLAFIIRAFEFYPTKKKHLFISDKTSFDLELAMMIYRSMHSGRDLVYNKLAVLCNTRVPACRA